MQPSDFKIGMEFLMSRNKWRCTDVGSRTIAAIKLEPDAEPGLYNGPPYKVVEVVIDEFSLKGCSIWDDAPDASDTEELGPDTEAGDMQSGTITPRAFKLSLSRRSQLFPARGVLLIDQGLEALMPLMRSRNFRVHAMPASLDENKIINPSLEDGEIGALLSQRILVTNRAELFREAAAVHEFSIIDTVERPWINQRLAGEISRRWFLIAGPSRPPSIVWIGRNGVSRFEPVD